MLGHARRDQHRGERCGPRAAGADRGGSEQPAKARLAGTDHPGDGGGLRHGGDHAPGRGVQALRLALAAAVPAEEGLDGLLRDKTRPPGHPASAAGQGANAVVERTLRAPPGAVTHWTGRAMAQAIWGLSLRTIQRIWAAHNLQPHRIRTFKRSTDPDLSAAKLRRCRRPVHEPASVTAVVVSIDEKSQIQALDRTQPGLPLKKSRVNARP